MMICLGLLIGNLGPSALAGFSVFVVLTPIQGMIMKTLFKTRRKTMQWTDKRAKLLQELLGGMKLIKFFAWENPFLSRIAGYRKREMRYDWCWAHSIWNLKHVTLTSSISYVRTMLLIRAGNMAVAMATPALASVAAFLVYAGTGHELTPAIIFASLTWFQLLRLPLMMLRKFRVTFRLATQKADHAIHPLAMSLSAISDARNAIGRLQECFTAELISESFERDPKLTYAVEIENASFTWDGPPPDEVKAGKGKKKDRRSFKQAPVSAPNEVKEEVMFKLRNIDLKIPRGQLVAIVGAVGCGKTSLLQGLIGDMRKTEGSIRFGGSLAYCSQSAWIQVGYLSPCGEAQRAELVYRTQQSAKIFASVGPSRLNVIGRLFMTPAWSPTSTSSLTGT